MRPFLLLLRALVIGWAGAGFTTSAKQIPRVHSTRLLATGTPPLASPQQQFPLAQPFITTCWAGEGRGRPPPPRAAAAAASAAAASIPFLFLLRRPHAVASFAILLMAPDLALAHTCSDDAYGALTSFYAALGGPSWDSVKGADWMDPSKDPCNGQSHLFYYPHVPIAFITLVRAPCAPFHAPPIASTSCDSSLLSLSCPQVTGPALA